MNINRLYKFRSLFFNKLIREHHVKTGHLKEFEFKQDEYSDFQAPIRGFLALKDEELYLLEEGVKEQLPILLHPDKLRTSVTKDGSVVTIVKNSGSCFDTFRITPEKKYSYGELLGKFDQKHTQQEMYTYLLGNIYHAALIGRINVCVAGNVSSGKSFYGDCMHQIYDLIPKIEKPKTAAKLAPGVSTEGVLRIDELSGLKTAEGKSGVETVLGSLADYGDVISFGTAGSRQYGTMNPPPTSNLSCLIFYNLFGTKEQCEMSSKDWAYKPSYYKSSDYFDWMFENSEMLNDRMLRMKLFDGKIDVSQFSGDDVLEDEHIQTFINMAKTVEYFREQRRKGYVDELTAEDMDTITNTTYRLMDRESRHAKVFRELLIFTYLMADKDVITFEYYADLYRKMIDDYDKMVKLAREVPDRLQGYTTDNKLEAVELNMSEFKDDGVNKHGKRT